MHPFVNTFPLRFIQAAINDRVREKLETVAREARRYAESYKARAEADAQPMLLVEPPRQQKRPRSKKGWSNSRKADYWQGMEQVIRDQIPRDRPEAGAQGAKPP